MTLCIAAYSVLSDTLVTVSDLLLSDEWSSAETRSAKVDPIGPGHHWLSMYAGDPTARQLVVRERMAGCLEAAGGDDTSRKVATAFEAAFREALKEKIEGNVLSRIGWDRETFVRRGLKSFGEDLFETLLRKVRATKLETSFLVAGWEASGVFRMFSVEDPGVTYYHDPLGFHAIGVGDLMALGYLGGAYDPTMSAAELVYVLCHAKFLGESAPGVGRRTAVWIVERKQDGDAVKFVHSGLALADVDPIRDVFERERRTLPRRAKAAAEAALGKKAPFPWSN